MTQTDPWYSKDLGDGMMASIPSAEIEEAFTAAFHAAGNPPAMAVFTRADSAGRMHCEVTAYFSPSAAQVARALGATPCPKPARAGLSLLAGDSRSWSVLFEAED